MVSLVCSEASLGGVAELGGRDFYARTSIAARTGAAALGTWGLIGWGRGGGAGRMGPTVPTLDLGVPDWSTPCCAPLARPRLSEGTGVA